MLSVIFILAAAQGADVKLGGDEQQFRWFASACLGSRSSVPSEASPIDAKRADYPNSERLKNARFYMLPKPRAILRMADLAPPKEGFVHFCELRARWLDLGKVWPLMAAAIDNRIDPRVFEEDQAYEVLYPAQRLKVVVNHQFLLAYTYDERVAASLMSKNSLRTVPVVNRIYAKPDARPFGKFDRQ